MPWYKLDVHHGPGHQTHTVEYHWYDHKLGRVDSEDEMERLTDMEWPVGKLTIVRALPEEVRKQKILEYRRIKAHAEMILKELGVEKP